MTPASSNSRELAGRVAAVTGSSGGIGRAIALELAAGGADVIVHCRKSIDAAQAVAREVEALGGRSRVIAADLSDPSARDGFARAAWDAFEYVDIWVNNAGADILTGDGPKMSFDEKLRALWSVDVLATMALSRTVGALMKTRGSGVILNMGWDQAQTGFPGDSGELFATVKGAVMCFTRSLALNLAPQVRANCLAPGWIRTAWGEHAPAHWQKLVLDQTPLARWGEPADVARVARFLAGPAAAFLTGQTQAINGGAVR